MLLLFLSLGYLPISAQVLVRINEAPPATISAAEFAALPRHNAVVDDHGKHVTYEGALLHDVVEKAGFKFGTGLRGKQLSSYVLAVASDGYQVVFALADLDPTIGDTGVIVADKRDGQALTANEGTLRIVAPNDKRPARSVRLLREIDVVQLNK
ncbi:MAG TPA: hypothetical protein VFA65_22965 [Bryobacteraceae bacterium]|nr:hypothetical protein [Bryobacteraceae bacterium]